MYCPNIKEIKNVKKNIFSNEMVDFAKNFTWKIILKIPKRLRDSKFGKKNTEVNTRNLSNERTNLFLNFLIKNTTKIKSAEKWMPEGVSKKLKFTFLKAFLV